ncbi:MAG: MFS transporter [Spirochaetia bacterium]|jgi:FSR family fosmidomycin resistance protein-like MFS transporter
MNAPGSVSGSPPDAPESDNPSPPAHGTVIPILFAISISHLINDTLQSLIPSIYPIVKESFQLNFAQIGLITFVNQITASLLQPLVGAFTDRRPLPYSLAVGMCFTLLGLVLLSFSQTFGLLLLSVALVGVGSSIFHPESSRVAHMAAGERRGFAQSFFQVGGNAGSSLGPLLAALIIAERGKQRVLWFIPLVVVGILLLARVGRWYSANTHRIHGPAAGTGRGPAPVVSRQKVVFSVAILLVLIFSKYFYLAGINSYYTFYMIQKFGMSIQSAQLHLFVFQFSVAAGTLIGGPVGDRIGRKYVIWISILGVSPLTILLPHAGLVGTTVLTVFIGVILSSAFSAILVYAQELIPGKVGMIAGLFFGFAFGMGALGSAALGRLADMTSIAHVYGLIAFLPLLGLIAGLLPNIEGRRLRSPA